MPKKLSDSEKVADPVRSRLEGTSRIAALAGQAAAPVAREEPVAPPPAQKAPRVATPEPRPEPVVEVEPAPPTRRLRIEHHSDHEALTVDRKARFTATEAEANSDLLRLVRRLTGTKPSEAAITRVLWALLREAEAGLKQEARKGIALRRPPNGPSIEMAAYERDLGRILLGALKSLEL